MVRKLKFAILFIFLLLFIILLLFCFTDLQPLSYTFPQKNYTALLIESFRVSVTYLQTHFRQIANQPSLENFLCSPSPLHRRSSVYWRSRLRIKLQGFVFREYLEQGLVLEHLKRLLLGPIHSVTVYGKFLILVSNSLWEAIQAYKALSWLVITKMT